jgi:hypothetical protein
MEELQKKELEAWQAKFELAISEKIRSGEDGVLPHVILLPDASGTMLPGARATMLSASP